MQKHERLALKAAEEILLPAGFLVTTENGGRAKMVILAEGHGLRDRKTIASSPKDGAHDVHHAQQWARRLVRRVS